MNKKENGLLRVNLKVYNYDDVTILSSCISNIGNAEIALENT